MYKYIVLLRCGWLVIDDAAIKTFIKNVFHMQDIRSHARTDVCCWVVFMTIMHDSCLYCNSQGVLPPTETMMGV